MEKSANHIPPAPLKAPFTISLGTGATTIVWQKESIDKLRAVSPENKTDRSIAVWRHLNKSLISGGAIGTGEQSMSKPVEDISLLRANSSVFWLHVPKNKPSNHPSTEQTVWPPCARS